MIMLWLISIVSLAVIEVDATITDHERTDSSETIFARVVQQQQVHRKRRSIEEDRPGDTFMEFPQTFDFTVTVEDIEYDLHLTKSNFVKHDIVITSNEGRHEHDFMDRYGVYESLDHMAAVIVECHASHACTITGVMDIDGQSYRIEPSTDSTDLAAHKLRKRSALFEDEDDTIKLALKHDIPKMDSNSGTSDTINKENSRKRRETLDAYCDVFEVKFLLDYDVWIYFLEAYGDSTTATEEIWKYYTAIFAEVNLRLMCITNYIDDYCPRTPSCEITCMRAVLVAIQIQTTLAETWTSQNGILYSYTFPDGTTTTFADAWKSLEYCGNYRTNDPDRYNYDILFCPTRRDITVTTNNVAHNWPRSYTWLQSVCMNDKRYSAVAIETKIDRMDQLITRNLMYSLSGFPCNEQEPSLMYRHEELLPSYWYLNWFIDDCTAEDVCAYVKTMNDYSNNCLRNHHYTHKWDETLDSVLLGELYTADEQCQMLWGDDSYQCDPTGNNNMYPEHMCSHLIYCQRGTECVCYTRVASGTRCGYAKYCLKGHCELKPDQDIDDECISHDQCIDDNAMCDPVSLTCRCRDSFYYYNGICYPKSPNGGYCQMDDDECLDDIANCVDNTCVCPSMYYNGDNGECMPKICLGNPCDQNDQCEGDNTKCDDICVCLAGYFVNDVGQCIDYDGYLDDPCITNSHCYGNLVCGTNYNCECPPPYVRYDNECVSCLGGICSTAGDCLGTDITCYGGRCVCEDGFFPDQYGGLCIQYDGYLDDPCITNSHCYGNLVCGTNYNCECPPPYVRYDNECVSCLGGICSTAGDCLGTDITCYGGRCVCEDGFFPDQYGGLCIQYDGYLDDPCITNSHCYGNLVCGTNYNCECPPPYVRYDNECVSCLGGICSTAGDCLGTDITCYGGRCVCEDGFFPDQYGGLCIQYDGYLDEPCSNNGHCCGNLVCGTNYNCECPPPYVRYDNECVSCLGGICSTAGDCLGTDITCYGGRCVCEDGFFPDQYGGLCIQYEGYLDDPCSTNSHCYGNLVCGTKYSCECPPPYVRYDNECVSCLGGICSTAGDCLGTDITCYGGRCVCEDGFFPDQYGGLCIQYEGYLDDPCSTNSHCYGNLVCGTNYNCECPPEYVRYDNECVSCLGGICTTNDHCHGPDTICVNETCICVDGFFPDGGLCIKYPGDLCDPCNDDHDCVNLVCGTNGHCQCLPEQIQVDDTCYYTTWGSACSNSDTCTDDPYLYCNGSMCVCSYDYTWSGAECIGTRPCDPCDPNSSGEDSPSDDMLICDAQTNRCSCGSNRVQYNGECYGIEYDDPCTNALNTCSGHNMECKNSKCKCKTGYSWNAGSSECIENQ